MRSSALVLILSACSFEPGRAAPDAAGSPGDDAPPIDAPTPTADDRDGDLVPDETDSCPDDFDPLERDHDGDGIGDPCDRCPHISDPADPDQDTDGVGDPCDPRITMPGDSRVAWIGFYDEDATLVASWLQTGTWSIQGGHVVQTPSLGRLDTITTTFMAERAYVMTAMRIDDYSDSSAASGHVMGLQGPIASPSQFYQCAITSQSGDFISAKRNGEPEGTNSWSGDLATGTVIEMVGNLRGNFTCDFKDPTTSSSANTSLGPATDGGIAFVSANAGVSFDYLFVATGP